MRLLTNISCALAVTFTAAGVDASQFYIFPIKEIEGLSTKGKIGARPLVDRRVVDFFTSTTQKELLEYFTANVAEIYPNSTIHSRQVREAIKGSYKFISNDNLICGEGFSAPIHSSYAIAIGLTRASYFEVDRGNNVELLIPITINLQLIKPERGKIAYSQSETIYAPFLIHKSEINAPQTKSNITNTLAANTKQLIKKLLESAQKNFNPQETPVKLIGKDGNFFVGNKGFEIGFQAGQEPLGITNSGKQVIFRVVSVDSGYTVLLPLEGSPKEGEEFIFTFETAVDDARKPRLMPVSSDKPDKAWSNQAAELFVKNIGFNAPFQIEPVDINFSDTMDSIRAQANCMSWDKYPSAKMVSDSRTEAPKFFLRFEFSQSPVTLNKARNSVKTSEEFITVLTAQVVDNDGNVVFSEIGSDNYELEKIDDKGLSLENAKEVSLKNATSKLTDNFRKSVKLTPVDFKISKTDNKSFWIEGFPISGQSIVYEVLRPLNIKINGKQALMKLSLDGTEIPPEQDGSAGRFLYSISAPSVPKPEKGDIVRVISPLRGHLPEMSACGDIYRAEGSMIQDHLVPIIRHVAYRSPRYSVSISDPDFYADTNRLLAAGFYKFRLPAFSPSEFCFKPGYKVVQKSGECKDTCTSTFLNASSVIVEKGGVRVHQAVVAQDVSINGFTENQRSNFIGFKSMAQTLSTQEELSRKFNSK